MKKEEKKKTPPLSFSFPFRASREKNVGAKNTLYRYLLWSLRGKVW